MIFDLSSKFQKDKAQKLFDKLIKLDGGSIELKQIHKKRSNNQNAWFHACVKIISDCTGYETEEVKTIVKRQCGLTYMRNGHAFLKSTAKLDKAEFVEFMDKFIRWTAETLEIVLPDPDMY